MKAIIFIYYCFIPLYLFYLAPFLLYFFFYYLQSMCFHGFSVLVVMSYLSIVFVFFYYLFILIFEMEVIGYMLLEMVPFYLVSLLYLFIYMVSSYHKRG